MRKLNLRKDTLAELSPAALRDIAGAAPLTPTCATYLQVSCYSLDHCQTLPANECLTRIVVTG